MRLRLLFAGSVIVLLAACGSGDGGGTRPTITATLPSSVVLPTRPPDAGTSPEDTAPPEQTAPPQVTEPPPETAQPEETAAQDTTPTSSLASGDDGEGTLWWPWVLVAIVVIGTIVVLARRHRAGPSWQLRTTTLLDDIEQLTSHLAAVTPDGLHAVAVSDANRLATMRATLRDLIESAPDANSQMALNGLTTSLAELHAAIDAIAMSADPSIQSDGASISRLATQLHTATASARADLAVHG